MQNIVIFLIFFLSIAAFLYFKFLRSVKRKTKSVINALLQQATLTFGETYFYSAGIRQVVGYLLKGGKKSKEALFCLSNGKFEAARDYLVSKNKIYLAAVLTSVFNDELGEEMFLSLEETDKVMLQLAYLYLVRDNKEKAAELINEISLKKLKHAERAVFYYCRAKLALDNGDLYNASAEVAEAVNIFHKNNSFYEEAKAYILSGEIYRVSAVTDTAYFMYNEAKKIALKHNIVALQADILGNMGMLMTMQENFDDAKKAFSEALDINRKLVRDKACACLYNQLGLLKLIEKKYDEAIDYINQALGFALPETNAFSFEIMGKINFEKENYDEAIKCALTAQKKYWKSQNIMAYFESLYLEALSLFHLKKYRESEEKIRHLLEVSTENVTAFHIANAYSLLGGICMKTKRLSSAKAFFEEAIRHELRNGRLEGMISDYLNLGIIERENGDEEGAQINFRAAERYAIEVQNENLCKIVRKYKDEPQTKVTDC